MPVTAHEILRTHAPQEVRIRFEEFCDWRAAEYRHIKYLRSQGAFKPGDQADYDYFDGQCEIYSEALSLMEKAR